VSHPQDRPPDCLETQVDGESGIDLVDLVDLVDDTFFVREVEVELSFLEGSASFEYILSKEESEALVATMYKRKGK